MTVAVWQNRHRCWQCLFCLMRQQHYWSFFTFGQTQLF